MSVNDSLKRRHELGLVERFFIPELRRRGIELRNPRSGGLGEPDVVCDAADGTRGVEVADAYMSAADATALWGMVRTIARDGGIAPVVTSTSDAPPGLTRMVVNPDARLAAALQAALDEHCRRRYGMPTYLLLNASHAPLTSAADATALLPQLRLPDHGYEAVFLCLARNWSWERVFFEIARLSYERLHLTAD